MPSVKYVGPFDEVEVQVRQESGRDELLVVKQGDSIEVSGDVAKSLLQQKDNWESTKKGGGS